MEGCARILPLPVTPLNFPTKLWLLVSDPAISAIRWDHRGEAVVIDKKLFEVQILAPNAFGFSENYFKTTHFSSFVRQLNLYGFKKVELTIGQEVGVDGESFHYFYNPNFQRNRPDLVATLKRLTVYNRAKLRAGLEVKSRTYNHFFRNMEVRRSNGGDRPMDINQAGGALFCHNYHVPHADPTPDSRPPPMTASVSATLMPPPKPLAMPMTYNQFPTGNTNAQTIHQWPDCATTAESSACFAPITPNQPEFTTPASTCCHQNLLTSPGAEVPNEIFTPETYFPESPPPATYPVVENNLYEIAQEPTDEEKMALSKQIEDLVRKTVNSSSQPQAETTKQAPDETEEAVANLLRNNSGDNFFDETLFSELEMGLQMPMGDYLNSVEIFGPKSDFFEWETTSGNMEKAEKEFGSRVHVPIPQETTFDAPSDEAVEGTDTFHY